MAASADYGEALAAGDFETLAAVVAEDVALYGPITEEPYEGREMVVNVLRASWGVLESLTRTGMIECDEVDAITLSGRLNAEVEFELLHVVRLDADGLVREITAYTRPLKSVAQWAQAVAPKHGKPPLPGAAGAAAPPQPS